MNYALRNAKICTSYCSKTGGVKNLIRPFQVYPKELETTKIENDGIQDKRNILILIAGNFPAKPIITWILITILVAQKIATQM